MLVCNILCIAGKNDYSHVSLGLQAKAAANRDEENSAENVAMAVLNEAKALRTKDNTSLIFLDFVIS